MSLQRLLGVFGVIWGIIGIGWLLIGAVVRLSGIALEIFAEPLSAYHWVALVFIVAFMAYSEGYRGFQLNFAPRFAARLLHLKRNPKPLHVLLAPLFCMGFFYSTRLRIISSMVLTVAIIILIIAVQYLQQPWRGILDFGVVVGLSWGILSVLYFSSVALLSDQFNHSAELPESASSCNFDTQPDSQGR